MTIEKQYILELTFSGPLLTQAAGTLAFGLDAQMQCYQGCPVINGSLIKGNIRHTLDDFDNLLEEDLRCKTNSWFGDETNDENYTPQRTQVDFDFFWKLSSPNNQSQQQRTRIAINPKTGTVKESALQIVEDCFPLGSENPVFTGKITARFENQQERKQFEKWVSKALDYIPAMGSFKGVGWGQLLKHRLAAQQTYNGNANITLPENATRFGIQLQLDRPFCIGRPRTPDSNQIVSDQFISGNVLKGLIARLYNNDEQRLETELCFNQLMITHALPADKHTLTRKMPLPLSLAILNEQVVDMAGLKQPAQQVTWKQAPRFFPDWKESDKDHITTALLQEKIEPEQYLVLRTQINEKGISEESKLFSLECTDPSKHVWCADIDLCNIPAAKQTAVFDTLQKNLKQGLTGIGKTKAAATLTFHLDKPFKSPPSPLSVGRHIITLNTAARMLPPNFRCPASNSAKVLAAAYQQYWQQVLDDDTVKLESYYAQQSLMGVYYHQKQKRHNPEKQHYYPEWLSDAGCVFVLTINNEKTLKTLASYAIIGLPAHTEADGSVANWKTTPYLPEHGYGEIQINNPQQQGLLYQQTEDI